MVLLKFLIPSAAGAPLSFGIPAEWLRQLDGSPSAIAALGGAAAAAQVERAALALWLLGSLLVGESSPRQIPAAVSPEIIHPRHGNALYVFALPN